MPTHSEKRQMPYSASEMYNLVADMERYPEFLPWNSAVRIRSRQPLADGREVQMVEMVISFKLFREKFGNRVVLDPVHHRTDSEYTDGPFRHFKSWWQFNDREGGGCDVDFHVDFEFRNLVLQKVIGVVFDEAMRRIVRAFETRAEALYGRH